MQIGGVEVVGECSDGLAVAGAVNAHRPDLIFLDITMPEFDGFQALQQLTCAMPQVIFVTAHANHAVRAYAIDATDYLLKPVSAARLGEALRKVRRSLIAPDRHNLVAENRLVFTQRGRTTFVDVEGIEVVIAKSNYLRILSGDKVTELRLGLSKLEAQLDSTRFLRVHRSIVVSRISVIDIQSLEAGRYLLKLKSGRTISTGRSYGDIVRRAFFIKSAGFK
jgi:two-component system, LytTR family, response regulator